MTRLTYVKIIYRQSRVSRVHVHCGHRFVRSAGQRDTRDKRPIRSTGIPPFDTESARRIVEATEGRTYGGAPPPRRNTVDRQKRVSLTPRSPGGPGYPRVAGAHAAWIPCAGRLAFRPAGPYACNANNETELETAGNATPPFVFSSSVLRFRRRKRTAVDSYDNKYKRVLVTHDDGFRGRRIRVVSALVGAGRGARRRLSDDSVSGSRAVARRDGGAHFVSGVRRRIEFQLSDVALERVSFVTN